ncbi:hypothetical protein CSAL01_03456 [Colletotrichum salicis]|uniref:Uncharacterized protein n=1 Tax=Colletotrichum salicis TaxID=1209931 RepID=A0A135UL12_9PEZI|nr:hypothetical protein CSAL01_03456 [Colletotrichum salicis]
MEQYGRDPEPQRSPSTFIYNLALRQNDQNSATSTDSMAVQDSPTPPLFYSQLHAGSLLERRTLAGRTIYGRPLEPLTVCIPHRRDMNESVANSGGARCEIEQFPTWLYPREVVPPMRGERHALAVRIRSVQEICLRASQKYHEQRARQRRNDRKEERRDNRRGSCLGGFRGSSRRPGPYDRPVQRDSQHNSSSSTSPTDSDRVSNESLVDSISRICDHLWEQAKLDTLIRLLGRGKKREAAATMAQLLEWAETVVECGDRSELSESPDRSDLLQLLEAAKFLCCWIGDSDGEAELGEVESAVTFSLNFGVV